MKKIILLLTFLFLINCFVFTCNASATAYSWFCVHRKDHLQPRADSSFSFIEDYDGYYIDKKHGDDSTDKVIYLTFDAGYENGNVKKILYALANEGVTAAFFVLGHLIEAEPELIRQMHEDGHLICNHTYTHATMVGKSEQEFINELKRLEDKCMEVAGCEISRFYRPPQGCFDKASLSYAKNMGYKTVFWSFAYADWDNSAQMSHEKAKEKILTNVHNGEIMLLHPTSSTNAEIISDIIRELKEQGYRFGSLEEL